jgi:hypothetical protein
MPAFDSAIRILTHVESECTGATPDRLPRHGRA